MFDPKYAQLPPQATELLLFGGTFDPVHRGHIDLGFHARNQQLPAAWLVFVPAAISPHKQSHPTPGPHRVEMLRLACEGQAKWSLWTEELRRAEQAEQPSYWVDTLEVAAEAGIPLRFLLGSDQALAFHRWHRWERILELATPLVLARQPHEQPELLRESMQAQGWGAPDLDRFFRDAMLSQSRTLDISATELRQQLTRGDTPSPAMLDPAVGDYIQAHKLYQSG